MAATSDKRPVIVTARKPRPRKVPRAIADATSTPPRIVGTSEPKPRQTTGEELSPEEVKRRGNAADELFRELVRRVTGNGDG